jgi:ABC-type arginine transport system permease subunit
VNRIQKTARNQISLFIAMLTGVLLGETIWLSSFRTSYDMEVYRGAFKALSAGEDPYAVVYGFHQLPLAGWLPGLFAGLGEL